MICCCLNFTESEKSQLFATKCQIFVKSLRRRRKHQQDFLNWNICLFVNCILKKGIETPEKISTKFSYWQNFEQFQFSSFAKSTR